MQKLRREIVFYVKQWLDEDEFRELLRFANYLGRDGRGSKFIIDPNKIVKNNVSLDDILDILTSLDVEFENGDLEDVEKLYEETRPKVTVQRIGEEYVLIPNGVIGRYIEDWWKEKRVLRYDKDRKLFVVEKPMYLLDIIESLEKRGVKVENLAGVKDRIELPIKLTFRGELRPYQQEALDAWRNNGYRGVISLPTGAGKTVIAIAALCELNVRTLIVVYTKEQMFQWREKILSFTDAPSTMIGLFYGEEKRIAPITITTYQSAYRYISMLSPYFSFLVVDEVHHLPADKFRYIAENAIARARMGLSATVVREDGRHIDLFPLMGGLVYHKSAAELADEGYLAPFRIIPIKVSLTPEEREKYRRLLEEFKAKSRGLTFEQLLALAKQGDRNAMEALAIRAKIRQLVHNSAAKIDAVRRIVQMELERGGKILVFTQYVEQAKKLAEVLGGYYVTGDLDETTRRRRLEAFKNGFVRVLVLTTVGDEGIDIPDANVGIIVAGTSSRRQFLQRLGRLLRPAPGKEARLYEIIVKDTFEEYEARKRRQALSLLLGGGIEVVST